MSIAKPSLPRYAKLSRIASMYENESCSGLTLDVPAASPECAGVAPSGAFKLLEDEEATMPSPLLTDEEALSPPVPLKDVDEPDRDRPIEDSPSAWLPASTLDWPSRPPSSGTPSPTPSSMFGTFDGLCASCARYCDSLVWRFWLERCEVSLSSSSASGASV